MKFILSLLLLSSFVFAIDVDISTSIISNAKTVLFEFKKEKNITYEKALIGTKEYKIFDHPTDETKMYMLVPISYYEKPNDKKIKIIYNENDKTQEKSFFIRVKEGDYEKESIKVSNSKVHLNEKDKKRAAKEYQEAMEIYNSSTPKSYIDSKFIVPLKSKITSDFGKARVYNDTLKGYHSGTDFRAKVGVPIKASNDGVVALAKDRFYSGGSIIIDHGQGIYTCYYHMSRFDVQKGTRVKKGQIIGLSGDSGRVTGPHLHFSVRVSGIQVDPLQFITLMNQNIFKGIQ